MGDFEDLFESKDGNLDVICHEEKGNPLLQFCCTESKWDIAATSLDLSEVVELRDALTSWIEKHKEIK